MIQTSNSYTTSTKLDQNTWITPPEVTDPDNLPQPLGWCLLVRPYPITQNTAKSKLILPGSEIDFLNYVTNIGRVVAIGDCCWNRPEHKMKDGSQKDWVKVGDFISFAKNVGARRKFKGVSYVSLVDDDVLERLPDPQVFDDSLYTLNIPQSHLEKYNTVYKKEQV